MQFTEKSPIGHYGSSLVICMVLLVYLRGSTLTILVLLCSIVPKIICIVEQFNSFGHLLL